MLGDPCARTLLLSTRALASVSYRSVAVRPWFGIDRHLVTDRFLGGLPLFLGRSASPRHTVTVPMNSALLHGSVFTFPLRAPLLQKQILPRLTEGLFGFSSARAECLPGFLAFSSSCVASVREFLPCDVSPASGRFGVIFWQALALEHVLGPVRNSLLSR